MVKGVFCRDGSSTCIFSLANRTYYTNPYAGQWNFELNIDRQALDVFEKIFQQMQMLEIANAWRAQLPYIQYHLDREMMKLICD